MMKPGGSTSDVISFGPFTLVASERLLKKNGASLSLGSRTLDILIALVSRPNQAIEKRDLMAQVWPDVVVTENSLRFHIAHLRKTLGDGQDGARYIITLAGRGYCFVATVSRSSDRSTRPAPAAAGFSRANVPSRLMRMVGRPDGVPMLATQLVDARFVTIVGAGGVGKTTVAVAVAHYLSESFGGIVLFVDLGALSDPTLAATSLASMLGLSVQSDDPTSNLIAYLRDKRILLILDNCEHLIEAAATLAARIFAAAMQVHILATSREALRVEGEHVHRLAPLAFPSDDPRLTAADALTYPAVQLFMERAAASGAHLELSDAEARIVASICRRLDGVALAIELAAGRVEAYGLQQTAALLEERLGLLWLGQRTAPPRQQTLKATLDWSYELLTDLERQVLRQLAVFVGEFTLDAALAVLTSSTLDQMLVLGAIDSLVGKSMVATNRTGTTMCHRLLDTTRDYVLGLGADDAELAGLAARHATYYRRWLEQTEGEERTSANVAERTPQLAGLGNVRSALEWCFGVNGNVEMGIELAAAAAPLFLALSLLTECHRWSERALLALVDTRRSGREEMQLQAALGLSLMFTRGSSEAVPAALDRSLAIAEERGDGRAQFRLLSTLHMFHGRIGEFNTALHYARRSAAVSKTLGDPVAVALGHTLSGIALYHAGDYTDARAELEAALRSGPSPQWNSTIDLGFDNHGRAGIALARTLWLQGHPTRALRLGHQIIKEATAQDHPMTLSVILSWAIPVFLESGDLDIAEAHIDSFISHAKSHSLEPNLAVGRGFSGQLSILRGDGKRGVESLQDCLAELHARRYEMLTAGFTTSLVQGLAAIGRFTDGIALLTETTRLVNARGNSSCLPEILRTKGSVLLLMPRPASNEARICFMQSLELSRRQGARAWELRTAVDLAALLVAQGRPSEARACLRPVFDQFTARCDTADLRAAERLLACLG